MFLFIISMVIGFRQQLENLIIDIDYWHKMREEPINKLLKWEHNLCSECYSLLEVNVVIVKISHNVSFRFSRFPLLFISFILFLQDATFSPFFLFIIFGI